MVIDIYAAMADGVWLYDPQAHALVPHMKNDLSERLPMTTRRIRGARKGAGWVSGVRLEPEPAPAVRWRPIARTRARQHLAAGSA